MRSRLVASSLLSASFFRVVYFMIPAASSKRKRRCPVVSLRMLSTICRSITE